MGDVSDMAAEVGRQADDSTWVDRAVRFGLVTYGLVHLLVGWVALQLAWGDSGGSAGGKGALSELARQPFGRTLLWLVGLGMVLLVLWRLLDLLTGHRTEDGARLWVHRAGDLLGMVVFGALGYLAVSVALGSASGGGSQSEDRASGTIMAKPFGVWMVGLVGVVVIVYGASLAWRGLSGRHADELAGEGTRGASGSAYLALGSVGHVAKGTSIALVGGLFVWAAWSHDPDKSGGLDAALRTVLEQPFGPVLLSAIAVGIACFGLFCVVRARHLSR